MLNILRFSVTKFLNEIRKQIVVNFNEAPMGLWTLHHHIFQSLFNLIVESDNIRFQEVELQFRCYVHWLQMILQVVGVILEIPVE